MFSECDCNLSILPKMGYAPFFHDYGTPRLRYSTTKTRFNKQPQAACSVPPAESVQQDSQQDLLQPSSETWVWMTGVCLSTGLAVCLWSVTPYDVII
jgi:hypothetical protein